MIQPLYFHNLLDCLAKQFLSNNYAECVGDEFGINISSNAKEYFSIAIIEEELPEDLVVLGVLSDDSSDIPSKTGFTFTIYMDTNKYLKENGAVIREIFILTSIIIIAHEICHFVFYYELFLRFGNDTGIACHSVFTYEVSQELMGDVIVEHDNTSKTIYEKHNVNDLLSNVRKFSDEHFSRGKETEINYRGFFDDFISHLGFDSLLSRYKEKDKSTES